MKNYELRMKNYELNIQPAGSAIQPPSSNFQPPASILLLFFLLLPLMTKGQDALQAGLTWQSSQLAKDQVTVALPSVFTTGPGEIVWSQNQGAKVYHLTVTGTSGTWTDVTTPGTITFQVTLGPRSGTLVIRRDASSFTLTLTLPDRPVYVFTLDSVASH
jgi:hypothetical protein